MNCGGKMFKRSRRKIILSIMGSLILLFALTLSVIMFASYRQVRQENMAMLERHVELYYLGQQPEDPDTPGRDQAPDPPDGSAPEPPGGKRPLDREPDYQLSTFYSVAFASDGSVLAADTGEKSVYSQEDLVSIAREILEGNGTSGRKGSLAYIVSRRPDYTLVAMMDNTVSENGLSTLLRNVLIVGTAAIVLMFFLSLFLSKQIIRPLEENDLRQKQFISDASHELKTPLAVIGTNAELLSREIGKSEWLDNIRYENERMGSLVTQLLDLSRAESAQLPAEQTDLSRIVSGEVLAFEPLAFEQGKVIRSDIREGISLPGNRTQLAQIVSILLDNAVRHASGSEISLSLKLRGHEAVLAVSNDSQPLPPEKLAHLFDRFYRVDEARSDQGNHYGLGLSIAKAIAERHGGSISAACRDGQICFTVLLPCKK